MKSDTKFLIGTGVVLGALYGVSVLSRDMMLQGMNTYVAVTPKQKVSIIIKNLNEEERIGKCIESLLNQSVMKEHPDTVEIICVDGGSTDASLEIARRYPIRVLETRRGMLHQMNEGILNSTGELIAFVDSDSVYPPNWVARMIPLFDDPAIMLVFTPFFYEDLKHTLGVALVMSFLHFVKEIYAGGCMVRRTVFEKTGLFDESFDCVQFARVHQESEVNFPNKARTLGRVYYQQDNPFLTNFRRNNMVQMHHECLSNPKMKGCRFYQEIGVERF